MAEPKSDTSPDATSKIPLPISKELRTLAHDLSNSIETIMQASYLLGQAKLDDANKKWLELIDQATRDAAKINREIREVLRSRSQE
jgi:signal transduction histidine kinase